MKRAISFWLLVFSFCFVSTVWAQNGAVTARWTAEPTTFTVGDPVVLTLIVAHPAGWRVIPADLPTTWGDLELITNGTAFVQAEQDGRETTYQVFDVTAWQPGSVAMPDLDLQISDADGVLTAVQALPISLTVQSVLEADDTTLRDIKPQASLELSPLARQYLLLGLSVLLVIGAFGLFAMLSRRSKKTAVMLPDTRTPLRIALDELDTIEQDDLPAKGLFKPHYSRITDTVRRYLAREYNITTMERTSFEIDYDLAETEAISADNRRFLMQLLNDADLVKFAKVTPDTADAREFINEARQFIDTAAAGTDTVNRVRTDDNTGDDA